ncbi:MAG: MATE family efflux transporter, partial [Planctomycetota bacterium]
MTEAQSDISGAPMVEPKDHALGEPGLEMGIPGGPEDSGSECTLEGIERRPLREILTVAAPSVVTMTSYTVMQFIDVLMVSRIGPEPVYVSAAGNGSIAAWLSIALPLGAAGVVNTFVSQNLGAGRPREGAGYVWTAVWLCALWYLLAVLPFSFFAGTIFGWTGHDGELLRLEVPYAQIALLGAGPILVSRTLQHYFYGMHRPNVVMIAAIAGNVVNLFANAAFIFGPAGMPLGDGALSGVVRPFTEAAAWAAGWLGMHEGMGVVGAAWGTLAGGVVELAIPAALFLGGKYAREFGSRERWRPSGRRSLELFRLGWPAGLMFLNELFCWSYLMVVLLPAAGEAAGEDPVVHNTAGWIALRYMHVSFMPAVGLSIAMTAV